MRVIVLFNLKPGVSIDDYENWAREVDLPTVNGLGSVEKFEVLRTTGLLVGEGNPPYQYVETIDISDPEGFGAEVSSETMQKVAGEFGAMVDATFMTVESL